ncbi:putative LRR receptor-like serine/threonine-protein kinase [Platanthera guangdongensis]|uniref:non-specific serine/threonine protein kinase n=1 Tax=Platanthera guangdongensis TaxID=2320717 RepID=A0ABR2M4F5_9ASPA
MGALNRLHLPLLFIFFLFSVELESQAYGAPVLSGNEVLVLKKIAERIGKKDWDFSVDPCSGKGNWSMDDGSAASGIVCDCHFSSNSTCHIIRMSLKSQNISGELPAEFGELRYLELLDLSRNVFNGSVPAAWSRLRLIDLELMGNRLSGPFPQVLTQMKTLKNLSIESNRFSGSIPLEIGTLVSLERLLLDSNQFTGELPATLARLTNLIDLRVSDNKFSGKVPDFIGNFTRLEKLQIQGSSLDGPIPTGISNLINLVDLRITDLGGNWSAFPLLSGMESLKTLILRNCSIHATIPSYLGNMNTLKIVDLSFNKLTGGIPGTFAELKKVDFIYLTENALTGVIPSWVLSRNKNLDISRNSFSIGKSGPTECPEGSVNLVESYGAGVDKMTTVQPCLKRNFPCDASTYKSSLHINCGGREKIINGIKYEADMEERGASMLYFGQNWAFSSTGNFMDNNEDSDTYIARNTSNLSIPNAELYAEARLSPLSLTYYGLCMFTGQYTVQLHFAETVFHDDNTFYSLGKRLFNVFIQAQMVLEDFNIEKAAGGAGKAIEMSFNASVTDHTLKIQFYWAGKGSTGIPNRGVYGPLISAISVRPNFVPPQDHTELRKATKVVIGISTSVFGLIFLALAIWWRKRCIKRNAMYKDLRAHDLPIGLFQLRQLKAATRNFHPSNKIGEGGFGPVYKGFLSDGTTIAVKQLSARSKQGDREFVNEIGTISALQHPNLVKLYGCCIEANQLLLVYEYLENNSLSRALFGTDPHSEIHLDWPTRCRICLDIARGLQYLHEESRLKIVHRDIKASNVLLDEYLNAKISDFGLAKLYEDDKTHISTKIAGTVGYMAPEYAMRGHLSAKADVYSFGVVALEIVTGKSNTSYRPKEDFVYLLDWACVLQERGNLLELVDIKLGSEYSEEEAILLLNVALLCTNASPSLRPTMSIVVSLLERRTPIQPMLTLLNFSDSSRNGVRRNFWEIAAEASLMNSLANTSVPPYDDEVCFTAG